MCCERLRLVSEFTMKKSRNPRFVVGPILIVGALGLLVVKGMQSSTLPIMPVSKLRAGDDSPQSQVGQRLRVAGFVGKEPVRKSPVQTPHGQVQVNYFNIEEHGKVLAVEYRDALPDTFRPGGPVQVDGEYYAPGKIRADHVFTKCPSKYESGEKGMKSNPEKSYTDKSHMDKPNINELYRNEPNSRDKREARSPAAPAKPSL